MTYAAPPARTEISDTYPNPSNAVARVGFGKLWDYVTGLLGSTGSPTAAKAALLVPQDVDFTNRIINGAMMIDQRNAGASVTQTIGNTYTVDRFYVAGSVASKFTAQQNAGSVSTLATGGFNNYLGITSSSAYSIGSTDYFFLSQAIEGLNVADLQWGTTNAKTVTLSFWVYSSLTGTFGGVLRNSGASRSYPFTYSISVANTWTPISITISGDTTGTWLTTNGVGIHVFWGLGVGATYSGTAGSWSGTNFISATGATSVVGTNGATFYITGVQLEKGTAATGFAYRPYGTELALCQRYYYKVIPDNNSPFGVGFIASGTLAYVNVPFPVVMRTTPTAVEQNGTASNYRVRWSAGGTNCSSVVSFVNGSPSSSFVIFTVASGLTAGQSAFGEPNSSGAYLGWSAEL